MKWIYLTFLNILFIGVVFGRSRPRPRPPPQVLTHEQKLDDDGNFFFNIKTENGISQREVGDANVRKGTYKFQSPEGEWVEMTYIADKDGFRVFGSHVPKFNLQTGRSRNSIHRRQGRTRVVRRKVVKNREEELLKDDVSEVTTVRTVSRRRRPVKMLKSEVTETTVPTVPLRRRRVKSQDDKKLENEMMETTVHTVSTVEPLLDQLKKA